MTVTQGGPHSSFVLTSSLLQPNRTKNHTSLSLLALLLSSLPPLPSALGTGDGQKAFTAGRQASPLADHTLSLGCILGGLSPLLPSTLWALGQPKRTNHPEKTKERGQAGSCRRLVSLSSGPELRQVLKHNEFCFITVLNELEGGRG